MSLPNAAPKAVEMNTLCAMLLVGWAAKEGTVAMDASSCRYNNAANDFE